jgi:replicative DNA helicase
LTIDPDMDGMDNPDDFNEDPQYSWDVEFQKQIISLLLVDKHFLLQSIDLVKPSYFSNKAHQKACQIIFDYYHKYRMMPRRMAVMQELKEQLKNDKSILYYLGEITALYDFHEPGLDSRDYLSDKITFFAKIHSLRIAFNKSLNLIDKSPEDEDTWSKVYDILRTAMNTDKNFDIGLEYFKSAKERYERMQEEDAEDSEKFVTGFYSHDSKVKGGGYKRGEMLSVVAGSGVGKSVYLTCLAATNALRGKKICYISTELSQDRVAERFDSILTGSSIHTLLDNKDTILNELEGMVEDQTDKNLIVIKQFPAKTADVNTIRAYLSQLKFRGFQPDVVIIDYVGEMKRHPDMKVYESLELLVSELHGLATEEKVFMATAMQPNRAAREAQKISRIEEEHLADSAGQIRPLDGCLSLNQNDQEKQCRIGRAWKIKERFGEARYQFYIAFDPDTLRITEISKEEYKNRLAARSDKVSDEVAIDMVVKEYVPSDAKENNKTEE